MPLSPPGIEEIDSQDFQKAILRNLLQFFVCLLSKNLIFGAGVWGTISEHQKVEKYVCWLVARDSWLPGWLASLRRVFGIGEKTGLNKLAKVSFQVLITM